MYFSYRTRLWGHLKRGLILLASGSFSLVRVAALIWSRCGRPLKVLIFVLSYLLVANYQVNHRIDPAYDWKQAVDIFDTRVFWLLIKVAAVFIGLEILGRTLPAYPDRSTGTGLPAGTQPPLRAASVEQKPVVYNTGYPKLADVGGLEPEKKKISDLIRTRLDRTAFRYGIVRNGILVHGPTGSGKSFLARAVANEFGLHFCCLSLSDLLSGYVFQSVEKIADHFARAAEMKPVLLFLDEFDAVAGRREAARHPDHIAATNQPLVAFENGICLPSTRPEGATEISREWRGKARTPG